MSEAATAGDGLGRIGDEAVLTHLINLIADSTHRLDSRAKTQAMTRDYLERVLVQGQGPVTAFGSARAIGREAQDGA